jgi:hypothetical protein
LLFENKRPGDGEWGCGPMGKDGEMRQQCGFPAYEVTVE